MSTSTGRIMREIGDVVMANGWRSVVAYSAGRDGKEMKCTSERIAVGSRLSVAMHGLLTRLTDRHGLGSSSATRRFIREIEALKPDVVHIHNVHGYFLNYRILFDYLARTGVKVIWTIHDCWLYTGHCYYYSFAGCRRWKTGCGNCPQRALFPKSLFHDRSAGNFRDKKRAFTSIAPENMVIVPVSEWIRREMQESFLQDYPFEVIHNGIDTEVFRPIADTEPIRRKYGIAPGKKIILGIASIWLKEKGTEDFMEMAGKLADDEVIVMVGVDDRLAAKLPKGIVGIRRTDNVGELAALYSAATAFVNPTWQDNYPTVNLEAQSCGTPVVTYRTGGSPESLTPRTGRVVEQGDVAALLAGVREFAAMPRGEVAAVCRAHAERNFRKQDRYTEYLTLYNRLIGYAE